MAPLPVSPDKRHCVLENFLCLYLHVPLHTFSDTPLQMFFFLTCLSVGLTTGTALSCPHSYVVEYLPCLLQASYSRALIQCVWGIQLLLTSLWRSGSEFFGDVMGMKRRYLVLLVAFSLSNELPWLWLRWADHCKGHGELHDNVKVEIKWTLTTSTWSVGKLLWHSTVQSILSQPLLSYK